MADVTSNATVYSIDTSSLMDWQARFYPGDVFPSVMTRVAGLIGAGRLLAAELVQEEMSVVGTGDMVQWGKAHSQLFVPTVELLEDALAIQNQFPGLRDPKAEFEEADAYVIALARARSGVVITQETPAAEKNRPRRSHFMPDVCRELGLPCISFLGLMRREKWVL